MVIELININKKIGNKEIIKDLSLKINNGKTFALLGPNGAGKTTLIRILLGLLKPDSGIVKINGVKLSEKNRSDLLLNIGVQNDGNLYENLTVKENLLIWGEIYGLGKVTVSDRIEEVSKMFHLEQYIDMNIGNLSKGNRQKVLLARAMFHNPDILILDEPTTGLDPEAIDEFYGFIKKLREDNVTVIMCMHYLYGLDNLVDSIAILRLGQILVSGDLDKLLKHGNRLRINGIFKKQSLEQINRFGKVERESDSTLFLDLDNIADIPNVVKFFCEQGDDVYEVCIQKESIKDIYFRLIGGA